ncbi:hypothetical protein HRbin16_03061 [bacterium HR16]|nr:hypothetical protein HRbin16_03061 [bacterium HR16]
MLENQHGSRWYCFSPADKDARQKVEWHERRGYHVGCILWNGEDAPDWFHADMTVQLDFGE